MTHGRTHTAVQVVDGSVAPNCDGVTPLFVGSADNQWPVAASFK